MRTALSKIGATAGLGLLSAFGALSVQAEGRQIEEVIVTAQRATESIQDVPIAVTALSEDMLEDRQITATMGCGAYLFGWGLLNPCRKKRRPPSGGLFFALPL